MASNVESNNRDQFFKIKMCPFFLKGICKKGGDCTFAHHESEIRVGISLRKTRMCQAWKQGECNDPNCKFAHGESELRCTPDYYKTSICKYWADGYCPQGDNCRHAHGEHELRKRSYKYTNEEKKQTNTLVIDASKNTKPTTTSSRGQSRRGSCVSTVSTVSTTSIASKNHAFVARKSNRPPPPPPGLSRPESKPAPVAEFYDGQKGDYVILPVDVYRTPKACDNSETALNIDKITFASSLSSSIPMSPSIAQGDDSFISSFDAFSFSKVQNIDLATVNSELPTAVTHTYKDQTNTTSPSSLFRFPSHLEQSSAFSVYPVGDTPRALQGGGNVSDCPFIGQNELDIVRGGNFSAEDYMLPSLPGASQMKRIFEGGYDPMFEKFEHKDDIIANIASALFTMMN